jgi:hypothetical protein
MHSRAISLTVLNDGPACAGHAEAETASAVTSVAPQRVKISSYRHSAAAAGQPCAFDFVLYRKGARGPMDAFDAIGPVADRRDRGEASHDDMFIEAAKAVADQVLAPLLKQDSFYEKRISPSFDCRCVLRRHRVPPGLEAVLSRSAHRRNPFRKIAQTAIGLSKKPAPVCCSYCSQGGSSELRVAFCGATVRTGEAPSSFLRLDDATLWMTNVPER